MKLGKRTDRLVREAMLLGFMEGSRWAGYMRHDGSYYPSDGAVVDRVYRAARRFGDRFPLLSRVERDQ